jgi:hypothetical protein
VLDGLLEPDDGLRARWGGCRVGGVFLQSQRLPGWCNGDCRQEGMDGRQVSEVGWIERVDVYEV